MSSRKIALTGAKVNVEDSIYIPQSNFLVLKESYNLSSSRAEGDLLEVEIASDDFVEFVFDDDTAWFGNTDTLHELFPEMNIKKRAAEYGISLTLETEINKGTRYVLWV